MHWIFFSLSLYATTIRVCHSTEKMLSLLSRLTFRSIGKCTQFAYYAKVNSKLFRNIHKHAWNPVYVRIPYSYVEQRFNVRYIYVRHLQQSFSIPPSCLFHSTLLFFSGNLFMLFVYCIEPAIGWVPLLIETVSTDNICIGVHCFCFQLGQLK